MLLLTLQPSTLADGERLERGVRQLASEDPTLTVETDGATGEVTIGTIGELQLELVVDRLKREFQVDASLGRPRVAYREHRTPAGSVRLEPVMRVDVIVPPEFAAAVLQDLSDRRGVVRSQEDREGRRIIVAVVPLEQLFGFHMALSEHTRGRGTHSLQLDSYQPVRDDPDATGGDSDPRVRVPRAPAPRPGHGGIAIPEPD